MKLRNTSQALLFALVLCGTTAFAQDQGQGPSPIDPNAPLQPLDSTTKPGYPNKPPVGAIRGVITPYDAAPYDPAQVTPDRNTLAGPAPITLGSLQHTRNTFDPAISVTQLGQTIPDTTGKTVLAGVSVVGGSLNFNRVWSEYHFSTLYSGGETFNVGFGGLVAATGIRAPHYQFHNLVLTQEANWARWHILLRDNFAASPGATFTGQGMGGPGLIAQSSTASFSGLGQAFAPSETINTGDGMRYQNSVLGQAEYSFSRRSAFTFAGAYGLLHFTGTGYLSSTMANAQAGYDYLLDPANSIAVLASYGKIDYTGTGVSTSDYMAALAYGRKITGRLAFQVSAGPQQIVTLGGGGQRYLIANVDSALTYERRRSGASFAFLRGLSAGSGVFRGATSNTFSFSTHHEFTRNFSGSVSGGYSMNNSLPTTGFVPARFDNWFVGGNLSRRVGLHANVNFNYGLTKQDSPTPCPVLSCGVNGLQQTFGMTVNWHLRPAE